jgi:hypothetical protein
LPPPSRARYKKVQIAYDNLLPCMGLFSTFCRGVANSASVPRRIALSSMIVTRPPTARAADTGRYLRQRSAPSAQQAGVPGALGFRRTDSGPDEAELTCNRSANRCQQPDRQ